MDPENCTNKMIPCIMSEEIKEMAKEMASMSNNIEAIKRALVGDQFSQGGLIEEVKNLKARIESLENLRWKLVGVASAVGSGITFLLSYLF
jgi:septal ring factor EnvC (AmiA/AmiB activator)